MGVIIGYVMNVIMGSADEIAKETPVHGDDSEKQFIPGAELSRGYFHEVVEPILDSEFPCLRYAAALIGYGSEVLGLDTALSTDHNWGPRFLIFLPSPSGPQTSAN